ncbi:MAG: WD40 repeat domain-containing protein [Maioricimonas sp. JB045]
MLDPTKTHVVHEWKHGRPLIACSFDPQGRYLLTSSEDYTLQRWSMETGQAVAWEAHDSWVMDLACLPDGEMFLSAGCDDRVILWPNTGETPAPIREIEAHKGWVRGVDASPDGTLFATGGNDHLVKIWSVADGTTVHELSGHESHVYSVKFHPTGTWLLSGDLSGKVHQWEVASGKLVRTFDAADLHSYNKGQQVHYGGVRDIAISPDQKQLACCGLHKATNPLGAINEPLTVLFDWETGEKQRVQPTDGVRGVAWKVEYLASGEILTASGGSGGAHLMFGKPDGEKTWHKVKLKNTLRDMCLHADGLQVATAHHDGYVRISRLAADG